MSNEVLMSMLEYAKFVPLRSTSLGLRQGAKMTERNRRMKRTRRNKHQEQFQSGY
jgi:hypothetical protein